MKKTIVLLCLIGILGCESNFGQTTVFTVNPGLNLNGASIGRLKSNLLCFVGVQYFNFSYDVSYSSSSDYDSYKYTSGINASVIMPFAGLKYFFRDTMIVKPYLNVTLFKPIISTERNSKYDDEPNHTASGPDFGVWIGEIGFGSEYFFNKHFSVGGEFGIRLFFSTESESSSNDYNDGTSTNELKMYLNMTYATGSLNFYF
jgi:hypothetical protein